jgi:hypothetical protein
MVASVTSRGGCLLLLEKMMTDQRQNAGQQRQAQRTAANGPALPTSGGPA